MADDLAEKVRGRNFLKNATDVAKKAGQIIYDNSHQAALVAIGAAGIGTASLVGQTIPNNEPSHIQTIAPSSPGNVELTGFPNQPKPNPIQSTLQTFSRVPEATQAALSESKPANAASKTFESLSTFGEFSKADTAQQKDAQIMFEDYDKKGDKFTLPVQHNLTPFKDSVKVYDKPDTPADYYHDNPFAKLTKEQIIQTAIEVPQLLHPQDQNKWYAVKVQINVGDKMAQRYGFVQTKDLTPIQPS